MTDRALASMHEMCHARCERMDFGGLFPSGVSGAVVGQQNGIPVERGSRLCADVAGRRYWILTRVMSKISVELGGIVPIGVDP